MNGLVARNFISEIGYEKTFLWSDNATFSWVIPIIKVLARKLAGTLMGISHRKSSIITP